MSIDLWADVVCPFCCLGSRQLQMAIERFDDARVVVHRRAFELDPHAPSDLDISADELVAQKFSLTSERARSMHKRLESQARELGMSWELGRARVTNTFDAHRLIAIASTQGLEGEMAERLYRAYFSEGRLVSDRATLADLAHEVGVEGTEALLATDAMADVVRADEDRAREMGIGGVPTFLIDAKFLFSGAQGADALLDVLQRAWQRRSA